MNEKWFAYTNSKHISSQNVQLFLMIVVRAGKSMTDGVDLTTLQMGLRKKKLNLT